MKKLPRLQCQFTTSCSFRVNITRALLVAILLLGQTVPSFSQLFFREYSALTGYLPYGTNDGRCIIKPAAGTYKFLSIGIFDQQYQNTSGHAIWARANGVLDYPGPAGTTNATKFNRTPNYDYLGYGLNFIEDRMVTGSYNTLSYTPTYTGHPATGFKVLEVGSPIVLYPITWTTIIDPTNRNTLWDHIITNVNDDISVGVSVLYDDKSNNADIYVLSQISNVVDATNQRIGITRYRYINGDYGHVVDWSLEYDLEGYILSPVGIVQAPNHDIVVAGNISPAGGGGNKIFTMMIDRVGGGITRQVFSYDAGVNYDGVRATSITGPFAPSNDFLISGFATESGTSNILPMIFSVNSTLGINGFGIYRYKVGVNYNDYLNLDF